MVVMQWKAWARRTTHGPHSGSSRRLCPSALRSQASVWSSRRMRLKRVGICSLVATVLSCVAMAGCGGTPQTGVHFASSMSRYLVRGDTLCAELNKEVGPDKKESVVSWTRLRLTSRQRERNYSPRRAKFGSASLDSGTSARRPSSNAR